MLIRNKYWKDKFINCFDNFIKNNSEENLIKELVNCELSFKNERKKTTSIHEYSNIWFRFFKDDTLVTTIQNIETDLKSSTNRKFIIDHIKIGMEKPKSIIINFS